MGHYSMVSREILGRLTKSKGPPSRVRVQIPGLRFHAFFHTVHFIIIKPNETKRTETGTFMNPPSMTTDPKGCN